MATDTPTTDGETPTGTRRQYGMPGVPTREEILKSEWQQVEALRSYAHDLLGTAQRGAGSSRAQTQDCAAVLAKVAAAMLDGARKMEKILTADED